MHPWPCLLLVWPMLLAYELSMWALHVQGLPSPRTGLDSWCRHFMEKWGGDPSLALPTFLVFLVSAAWARWQWRSGAPEGFPTWSGMLVESCLFALLLWGLYHGMQPHLPVSQMAVASASKTWNQVAWSVSYLGAGIYEETVFRLLIFGMLWGLLHRLVAPFGAFLVAASISSVLFAYAHHWGPVGEAWESATFLFRCLAGVMFCFLYAWRGYGVAVGTHAFYDVLVGIAHG